MGGVSFDRAAGYYDATRGLPADVETRVTDVLASELSGISPCLEIGTGTGRISLPLAERGVGLIGADLAPAMLARLVANAGGSKPFPLLTGDVTRLPLLDSSVGAVLGCHVLHLIPEWSRAVDEAIRVLRPGGRMLLDFGGPTPKPWSGFCEGILRRHGVRPVRAGVSSPQPVADHLGECARLRRLPAIEFELVVSLAEELELWERQLLAWTWSYAPEEMRRACQDIRQSAGAEGWAIDQKVRVVSRIQWWAFDVLMPLDGPPAG